MHRCKRPHLQIWKKFERNLRKEFSHKSIQVYKALCPLAAVPKPRYATLRTLFSPRPGGSAPDVLDSNALVLHFPAPRTVTGQDVLELHVHGGPATVKAVLSAIPQSPSTCMIRYAEPGEFTRRAFFNNRLDLAQVESLSDTLAAETEQQRRVAVRGNSGALGRTYEGWREKLLLARGEIEALIDFSEDQHFEESPTELLSNVTRMVNEMLHDIVLHEVASQRSELLRKGIRIALLGPPNVGKSSLMNQIVGREASIVSVEAGTTRDIVEASLDIRGYFCSFADTAGFRSGSVDSNGESETVIGLVEEEGIRRAKRKAMDSDIIIVMASVEPSADNSMGFKLNYDEETLHLAAHAQACLVAINKQDSVSEEKLSILVEKFKKDVMSRIVGMANVHPITISCRDAEALSRGDSDPGHLQSLVERLVDTFSALTSMPDDLQDLLGVTERQRQLLVSCREHLNNYLCQAQPDDPTALPDIVLAAEYLRYAANSLARITGRGEHGDVEEVLGVIFEK
jgi:tRNA modification GTPase